MIPASGGNGGGRSGDSAVESKEIREVLFFLKKNLKAILQEWGSFKDWAHFNWHRGSPVGD